MSMPFIAIKCVDEMCTLDSALVQCALLHRAVGTARWGGGGAEGSQSHFGRSVLTLSQSGGGADYAHHITTSPPDYQTFLRPRYIKQGWVGPEQAATAQGPWKVDLVLTIAGHLAIA